MSSPTTDQAPQGNLQCTTSSEAKPAIARHNPHGATLRSEKITDEHLQRIAIVYVRQSTQRHVLEHRESTARQYALADRAVALGWPSAGVEVIDEDQGRSGSSAEGRSGFQRLLAEVSSDRVGLILGLEMSRLARLRRPEQWILGLRTTRAESQPRAWWCRDSSYEKRVIVPVGEKMRKLPTR